MREGSAVRKGSALREVLRGLVAGVSAFCLLLAVVLAVATVVVPRLLGADVHTVLTGSMRPSIPPGSLVIVRPLEPDRVRVGDVITYQLFPGKPQTVTHRVVGVTSLSGGGRAFVTRGDNNHGADPEPVLPVQVRGTVAYTVPWLGWVNNLVGTRERGVGFFLVVAALFGYGGWQVWAGWRERRRTHPGKTSG